MGTANPAQGISKVDIGARRLLPSCATAEQAPELSAGLDGACKNTGLREEHLLRR